ncbi:MoxR family ATPase [Thiohalocapsa sp. ML1]|jgi:MoxR-like ATPase|uniref:AAA family ATPase n=1 Tax=Thiohalocapsa sp. ML1 TaxID=1431688 RepID=UPI0007320C9A|nr:AAA family ATPase [Thiohalocapsa sp. ML1]
MSDNTDTLTEEDFAQATADLTTLRDTLCGVLIGQREVIDKLLCALLAGGHVLLEGLPGLGKTHLVKGLARALDVAANRIQCTPDLMPADLTGSEVWSREHGVESLQFLPGPMFANLVLVDEINRATPKTQSALLEAMQESQVTYNGQRHPLPRPFWIVATQNPIEIEGTYPLPEAQLDRFAMHLRLQMPDADTLLAMVNVALDAEPSDQVPAVLAPGRLPRLLELARAPVIADTLKLASVDLILATHGRAERPGAAARGANGDVAVDSIRYGASPRGLQALLRCARVHALLNGRVQVCFDDLETVALPCLSHRVVLNMDAVLAGTDRERVLASLLDAWRARWRAA